MAWPSISIRSKLSVLKSGLTASHLGLTQCGDYVSLSLHHGNLCQHSNAMTLHSGHYISVLCILNMFHGHSTTEVQCNTSYRGGHMRTREQREYTRCIKDGPWKDYCLLH